MKDIVEALSTTAAEVGDRVVSFLVSVFYSASSDMELMQACIQGAENCTRVAEADEAK